MTSTHKRRVTLQDIADASSVSLSTVSRALNGQGDISEDTRRSIIAAARSLGYEKTPEIPEKTAVDSSITIGLMTDAAEERFSPFQLVRGAEDMFTSYDASVLLCTSRADPLRERHYIDTLIEHDVDGLIVVGLTTNQRRSISAEVSIPVVYAFCKSDDVADCSYIPDDVAGGEVVTEHMISMGRRHIAHITGPRNYLSATERHSGFSNMMAEAGLEPAGEPMYGPWWTQQWGRRAARMLLTAHPEIDGIVCGNDQIATGAIEAAMQMGRKVPEDVSVTGYDNWSIFSEDFMVPLTTMDMNLRTIGQKAALTVYDMLSGNETPTGQIKIAPQLMIRESTSPLIDRAH